MIRATQRRRLLNGAQARGEIAIASAIQPLLTRRFKQLNRDLRRANLRKRLRKNLRDSGQLIKQDDGGWPDWIDEFSRVLYDSMLPVTEDLYGIETKFWEARQVRADPVDAAKILSDYQARVGRQITNIAETTRDNTLSTITDWYNTDASLPELIDSLTQWYSPYRAETIARTETTYITSGVSRNMMQQFDVGWWNWDLADEDGDWPCDDCIAMAQAGPYQPDDEMPPLHPRDRCGIVYAQASGEEIMYGSDIAIDEGPIDLGAGPEITEGAEEGPMPLSPEAAELEDVEPIPFDPEAPEDALDWQAIPPVAGEDFPTEGGEDFPTEEAE